MVFFFFFSVVKKNSSAAVQMVSYSVWAVLISKKQMCGLGGLLMVLCTLIDMSRLPVMNGISTTADAIM